MSFFLLHFLNEGKGWDLEIIGHTFLKGFERFIDLVDKNGIYMLMLLINLRWPGNVSITDEHFSVSKYTQRRTYVYTLFIYVVMKCNETITLILIPRKPVFWNKSPGFLLVIAAVLRNWIRHNGKSDLLKLIA